MAPRGAPEAFRLSFGALRALLGEHFSLILVALSTLVSHLFRVMFLFDFACVLGFAPAFLAGRAAIRIHIFVDLRFSYVPGSFLASSVFAGRPWTSGSAALLPHFGRLPFCVRLLCSPLVLQLIQLSKF